MNTNKTTWTPEERMARKMRKTKTEEKKTTEEKTTNEVGVASGAALDDEATWTLVKPKKVYKPKRELTIDEMDARERELRVEEEQVDADFNGELLESNRHDHHRV